MKTRALIAFVALSGCAPEAKPPEAPAIVEQVAPDIPRWRYQETLGYVRRIGANYELLTRDR